MRKAKAKTKAKARTQSTDKETKKTTAKKSADKGKDANPVEMRQQITNIAGIAMDGIAKAVVDDAKKGQLATVKYLFEVIGVYPRVSDDENANKPEEDTLARRLIQRLGLPEGPLPSCEDDDLTDDIEMPAGKIVSLEEKKASDKTADVAEMAGEVAGD
jgi:hypothetical protein